MGADIRLLLRAALVRFNLTQIIKNKHNIDTEYLQKGIKRSFNCEPGLTQLCSALCKDNLIECDIKKHFFKLVFDPINFHLNCQSFKDTLR